MSVRPVAAHSCGLPPPPTHTHTGISTWTLSQGILSGSPPPNRNFQLGRYPGGTLKDNVQVTLPHTEIFNWDNVLVGHCPGYPRRPPPEIFLKFLFGLCGGLCDIPIVLQSLDTKADQLDCKQVDQTQK